MPVDIDQALNERNYGELNGMDRDEAVSKYGKEKVCAFVVYTPNPVCIGMLSYEPHRCTSYAMYMHMHNVNNVPVSVRRKRAAYGDVVFRRVATVVLFTFGIHLKAEQCQYIHAIHCVSKGGAMLVHSRFTLYSKVEQVFYTHIIQCTSKGGALATQLCRMPTWRRIAEDDGTAVYSAFARKGGLRGARTSFVHSG